MDISFICKQTTKPEMLNALHACRPNHPLNNPYQWRNAYAMACQQPSYVFDSRIINYLKMKAMGEE